MSSEENANAILKIFNNFENTNLNFFTNRNFEKAVKSGHEIMLTNDEYYYFEEKFFSRKLLFLKEYFEVNSK